MRLEVRPARLQDAPGICRAHQGSVETWFRYPQGGPPIAVPYAELDDAERWRNGGPWMVPTLCQAHLAWLLGGAGFAWVALLEGEVIGEAEAFLNEEPPPLGRYLNLSVIYVHRQAQRRGAGSALVGQVLAMAAEQACDAVLVDPDAEVQAFYTRCGFSLWQTMVLGRAECTPAEGTGRPSEPGGYAKVAGLPMPVGRYRGARQEWEQLRGPALMPQAYAPWRRDWRMLRVAGEPVWAAFAGDHFEPERADLYAWGRAPLEALVRALLVEAGALGYHQASLLLEGEAFQQLRGCPELAEAGRREAWWHHLGVPTP